MKPIHYKIHLEPDLEKFVFKGTVSIDIDLETPTSQIVVKAKNLDIPICKYGSANSLENAPFEMDKQKEEMTITLPTDKAQEGRKILYFEFSGELNDMLLGFYRSKYVVDGQTKYAATTQFEEREARAAFPCFDEPALKATFDIEYLIKSHVIRKYVTKFISSIILNSFSTLCLASASSSPKRYAIPSNVNLRSRALSSSLLFVKICLFFTDL